MNEPTCEYLVWDENHDKQIRCGLPAKYVSGNGFHYCETCGHKAVEEMGWKRRRLALKEIEK